MLLVERCLQSWGRAETAVKLIDRGFAVEDAVDAARQCGDLQRSLRFLQQECPLCFDEKPMSQVKIYPCHKSGYVVICFLNWAATFIELKPCFVVVVVTEQ